MNTKHLLVASFVGGLISTVLVNTPYLNLINVLICAGFWIGPLVAVWLYRRQDGALTLRQGVVIGVLAGAWHWLFGVLLSPLGLAGAGGLLETARPFVPAQDLPDLEATLTGFGAVLFNLVALAFDVALGLTGGLVGGALLRGAPGDRAETEPATPALGPKR